MALSVQFQNGNNLEFHVGDREEVRATLKGYSHHYSVDQVLSVQADGHELERIHAAFGGFTPHAVRVQRFFGDQAKYIYANWY